MRISLWVVAGVMAFGVASEGRAQEPKKDLAFAARQLAGSIVKVAEKLDQKTVRIGAFSAAGIDDGSTGTAISDAFAQALGDAVRPESIVEVNGSYGYVEHTLNGQKVRVIKIKARMQNTSSLEDLKEFLPQEAVILDNATIGKLRGVTARLESDDSKDSGKYKGRNDEIERQSNKETRTPPVIQDTKVIGPSGQYAIEILVKGDPMKPAVPRAPVERGKQAFVPIEKGEIYEIRIHNNCADEAACTVSIDGLDMFTFSEQRGKFSHMIVPPGQHRTALGWHKSVDAAAGTGKVLRFLVTDYGEGAISKFPTKARGAVGLITVTFALSLTEEQAKARGARSAGAETGFGPEETQKQKVVKRKIEAVHEIITVRYTR